MVLLPAALLTAGLSYSLSSPTSGSLIAAALADPLSVFADRSPGKRISAALHQTKNARAHNNDRARVAALPPSERVLTNVRTRPPVAASDAPQYTDALLTTPLATDGAVILPDIGIMPPISVAPTGIGSIPGFVPGGVGFLPGGGGGVTPVEPGVPGVPGVPEPSTWLMLIVGFFAIGFALRSKSHGVDKGRGLARG